MTVKEEIASIRKSLRKLVPGLSVRIGKGTARGWVDIRGSGEFGHFTPEQMEGLRDLGISPGMNLAVISPDDRAYWMRKFDALAQS